MWSGGWEVRVEGRKAAKPVESQAAPSRYRTPSRSAMMGAPAQGSHRYMLIRVSHLTTYHYGTPATSVIQTLRLTPRNHDGQFVMNWRIDVSKDCRLDQ